ncbi:MAG: amidohydrolase, partial [Sphingomonadaceae bacterium]|nr:amidohydrolase [Sphingomonadaceae bacterium]
MIRLVALLTFLAASPAAAESGSGPYPLLVIRGATIITGDGAPPYGPADIVVRNGR